MTQEYHYYLMYHRSYIKDNAVELIAFYAIVIFVAMTSATFALWLLCFKIALSRQRFNNYLTGQLYNDFRTKLNDNCVKAIVIFNSFNKEMIHTKKWKLMYQTCYIILIEDITFFDKKI